jgi:hypothetical protein
MTVTPREAVMGAIESDTTIIIRLEVAGLVLGATGRQG